MVPVPNETIRNCRVFVNKSTPRLSKSTIEGAGGAGGAGGGGAAGGAGKLAVPDDVPKGKLAINANITLNMQILDNRKYLGVYLGHGGCEKTLNACEDKYLRRRFDISLSVASALLTIARYNERAEPVFSYVSQVLLHPDIPGLKRLEQRGFHEILELPPTA